MRKILLGAVLLLLFASPIFSVCSEATRQIFVPAVVSGQEGGLLTVTVETKPGQGEVYTKIDPVVGASTQISQKKAVEQAFESANKDAQKCDVYFEFGDIQKSPVVDGPSAGLAMTIALKSALEQTQLREDIAVTGAIASGGIVGQVGGIIDKAQAASRSQKQILITPKQAIYENILLSKLAEEYDFVALEASNLQEAYEIATSNKQKRYESNFELQLEQIPENLPPRELNLEDEKFSQVAQNINEELLRKIESSDEGELEKYNAHFEQQAQINEQIISMGYGYTAANNAFLSQIDAAFLSTPPHKLDLQKEIEGAQQCVDKMPKVDINEDNFEWVAGGNARKNWANSKILQIKNQSDEYHSQEEKYLALREIYYARSWCLAGTQMLLQAQNTQTEQIDLEQLESYARLKVSDASKLVQRSIVKNGESQWHIEMAEDALENKDYAGALFDAAYSSAMQISTNNQNEKDSDHITSEVEYYKQREYRSLWARTYQSQGVYTSAKALQRDEPIVGAYSVLILANSMEQTLLEMNLDSTIPIRVQVQNGRLQEVSLQETLVGVVLLGSVGVLFLKLLTLTTKRYKH